MLLQTSWAQRGALEQRLLDRVANGERFRPASLFSVEAPTPETNALWSTACRKADVLRWNADAASELLRNAPELVEMRVPRSMGEMSILLERADITADGFQVVLASTRQAMAYTEGLHYRGVLRNAPGSIVAVSVFPDMMMALIADANGQWVLGPFEEAPEGLHVFYHDADLLGRSTATCATPDEAPFDDNEAAVEEGGDRTVRCVGYYWEVAYDIVQNKGSVVNATNYISGLFNQSALLFLNDGIDMNLTELFVWDVASPYNATSSSGRLNQFGTVRTSFNGNLAHLIDLGNYGGVAWLNTICSNPLSFRMAYSGINANYSNVPTYSWSVNVVTHEAGHNLGSQHTHGCVWNGNNTAIDGCGPAAGYTEGSCPQGPIPTSSVGGTIMSYCHLTSSTIKFANGFGIQPAQRMQNRINAANCLPTCGTTCDAPLTVFVSSLSPTAATLSWTLVGAVNYDLRWKPTASGTWNQVNGITSSSYILGGLSSGVEYEFQVRANCTNGTSEWSVVVTFTTPLPCTDPHEPNNSIAAATAVTPPITVNGLISPSNDVDYYGFTVATNSSISLSLFGLPADYDLRLRNSAGTVLQTSQNGGTSSEFISYTADAGTYYAEVYGYSGANNASICYSLSITVSPVAACGRPDGLTVVEVGTDEATLSWPAVQGVSGYDVQIRQTGTSTWTVLGPIPTNAATISGLAPSTEYEVQVRSRCSGAGQQGVTLSDWTGSEVFTTLSVGPCDGGPEVLVQTQVWLDGPFNATDGLMSDLLRTTGALPLQEPYTALGYDLFGAQTIEASVLNTTGSNAIVDWVLVELRSSVAPAEVVQRRAGLLQRDGDIVDVDGVSPLSFCVPVGNYHVAVRHRNHLGCMSASTVALGATSTTVDLRSAATGTWGTDARKQIGQTMLLWPGNSSGDDRVMYTGTDNDRDLILFSIGGTVPTNSLSGYHMADLNLDALVKYTGDNNDRDLVLSTIGGVVPTNTKVEQLP
ncbi:MAG: fibronectin type III domain-containing protein [Flavobacteriales bacterium]|nr:fibronectin type III domain-containing protein [Flavobacteriales bacterium]